MEAASCCVDASLQQGSGKCSDLKGRLRMCVKFLQMLAKLVDRPEHPAAACVSTKHRVRGADHKCTPHFEMLICRKKKNLWTPFAKANVKDNCSY